MRDPRIIAAGVIMRGRNRTAGLDRYRDPRSYFGPGGLEEARALCAVANRDLPGFIRPPETIEPHGVERCAMTERGDGVTVEDWFLDSPMPSGDPDNDRVQVRLYRPPEASAGDDRVVLFHHPVYQRRFVLWEWFLAALIRRVPVAVLAGPYHFGRTGEGRFPGEGTVNPNPARMFLALRQWSWDHQAAVGLLSGHAGLRVSAEIGFSLGAFQSLLLGAAGRIDVPIVAISATNRYAWGLMNGMIGKGLLKAMREVGIGRRTLVELTRSVQLERHVAPLHGRPVFNIRGIHDWVDPPPSLDRLERALEPARSLHVWAGHGTLVLHRRRVIGETAEFLEDCGALPPLDEPSGRRRSAERIA